MEFRKLDNIQVNQLSPLVLAFVGDSVFDLFIRSRLAIKKENLLIRCMSKLQDMLKHLHRAGLLKWCMISLPMRKNRIPSREKCKICYNSKTC